MRSICGRNVTNCWSHAIVCITNHPEAPLKYRPQTRSDRLALGIVVASEYGVASRRPPRYDSHKPRPLAESCELVVRAANAASAQSWTTRKHTHRGKAMWEESMLTQKKGSMLFGNRWTKVRPHMWTERRKRNVPRSRCRRSRVKVYRNQRRKGAGGDLQDPDPPSAPSCLDKRQ